MDPFTFSFLQLSSFLPFLLFHSSISVFVFILSCFSGSLFPLFLVHSGRLWLILSSFFFFSSTAQGHNMPPKEEREEVDLSTPVEMQQRKGKEFFHQTSRHSPPPLPARPSPLLLSCPTFSSPLLLPSPACLPPSPSLHLHSFDRALSFIPFSLFLHFDH